MLRVLALERADVASAWQLPQGRLEASEEPLQAVLREVFEETEIPEQDLELLDFYPGPLAYELPLVRGAKRQGADRFNTGFFSGSCRKHGRDGAINVTSGAESRAWRWMPFSTLLDSVADFRKAVYRRLAEQFQGYFPEPRAGDPV